MIRHNAQNDQALLRSIAQRDQAAFSRLIDNYSRPLFALGYRMGYEKNQAEDMVQETLIRLWQHAEKWDETKGASIATWLYRVMTNLCLDDKRKKQMVTLEAIGEPEDNKQKGADHLLYQNELKQRMDALLETLPDRQRAALVLFHYEGVKQADIADILDTSVKSVESLLVRAKRHLRAALEHSDLHPKGEAT